MKKLVFFFTLTIIVSAVIISVYSQATPQKKKIIYTTADLKQNYEIIQVITGNSDFAASAASDQFAARLNLAWNNLMTDATKVNADAVVGIKVEFVNATTNAVGRIIVYGTAVKFPSVKVKK